MKKIFAILIVAVLALATTGYLYSQVTVNPNTATYPTVGAAFTAINGGTHGTGAITVTVTASTTEPAPATLLGGVFASLTLMPTAAVTVSGNFPEAVIVLDGPDNVIIDGRIGGTGTTRSLTLSNTDLSLAQGCIRISNGASNNTVRFTICNGVGVAATGGGRIINISQSTPSSLGGNNNNIIDNNLINGGRRGIQTFGTAPAGTDIGVTNDGTIIRNNIVKNISSISIFIGSETRDNTADKNEILTDAAVTGEASPRGIVNQGVGTANITRNYIHDFVFAAGANGPFYSGIFSIPVALTAPGSSSSTENIINNMISMGGSSLTGDMYGILASEIDAPFHTANVYYNSVRIFGTGTVDSATTVGIEGEIGAGAGSVYNQYNNLVRNDRTGGNGASHVGMNMFFFIGTKINSDYNTTWASDPVNGFDASINLSFGFNQSNLQLYRDIVASFNISDTNFNIENSELHTAFMPAPFVSNTDLHLIASQVGGNMNARPFPAVTTIDFDGETRSATFPYRGADEIVTSPLKVLSLGFALEAITNPSTSKADVVTVELRNPANCALIASSTATLPATPGNTAMLAYGDLVANGTPFYIRVIHRNSISVWSPSLTPQSFAGGTLVYDFTTGPTKAHSDGGSLPPLKLVGTEWSAYTGDVNQDGIVDAADLSAIDNFSTGPFQFDPGYEGTDLNFDLAVDATDLSLADNNSFLNAIEQAPCFPTASLSSISKNDAMAKEKIKPVLKTVIKFPTIDNSSH